MRFLVRLVASGLSKDSQLATVRTLAVSVGVESRNPKWTSYGALELDIFCPTKADFDIFLSTLAPLAKLEFVKDLNVAPPHKAEPELLAEAQEYFNAERYWECHEVLEGVWRQKQGPEKRLLQGIILVCAAFVHHQKGEESVALGILRRASGQLDYPAKVYGGFSVPRLRQNVEEILRTGRFSNFRT